MPMFRKYLGLALLFLSYGIMLGHNVIPHHHHSDVHSAADHHHDHQHFPDHHASSGHTTDAFVFTVKPLQLQAPAALLPAPPIVPVILPGSEGLALSNAWPDWLTPVYLSPHSGTNALRGPPAIS